MERTDLKEMLTVSKLSCKARKTGFGASDHLLHILCSHRRKLEDGNFRLKN